MTSVGAACFGVRLLSRWQTSPGSRWARWVAWLWQVKLVWLPTLALTLLVLGAEGWSLLARQVAPSNVGRQDFRPLVMVWRDSANYGINGTPGSQLFRLDYTDRCHQRLTLLEHSAWSGIADFYTQFDGPTRITHYQGQPRDDVEPLDPKDCWPPDRYLLVPIAFENPLELATRPGWVRTSAGDDLMLVSYDGTVAIAGAVVPEHIEVTYQPTDGLPMRVVHVINGKETQRREVIELHVSV